MDYLRALQDSDDERRRALRAAGGLLLGVGALVLAFRRSSFPDPWGDFALFLVALAPALVLYGGGMAAALSSALPRAWHAAFIVFGLVFVYATLSQFVDLVGGNSSAALNVAWIALTVAVAGAAAAERAAVRFGWLAAGIALTVAWLALWDELLSDGLEEDPLRILSLVAAAGLVAGAFALRGREPAGAPAVEPSPATELVTAAGLAFLLGTGVVSLGGAAALGIAQSVTPLGTSGEVPGPALGWDALLLAGSLAFVVYGAWGAVRGPVYVGALGLAIFTILVGLDLDDSSPAGTVVGWPLVLLALGAAALVASALVPAERPAPQAPPSG